MDRTALADPHDAFGIFGIFDAFDTFDAFEAFGTVDAQEELDAADVLQDVGRRSGTLTHPASSFSCAV
jgi:hypothetical protein